MTNIIIILGAPNDDDGNLSIIAQDRLNCAYRVFLSNTGFKIICTGGFGAHFNKTEKPHSYYAKQFLIARGVPEETFLDSPLTSNTIEDFTTTKDLIYREKPDIVVIITSDFHMARAKILYKNIVNYDRVLFISAASSLSEEELKPLLEHEEKAIESLLKGNRK